MTPIERLKGAAERMLLDYVRGDDIHCKKCSQVIKLGPKPLSHYIEVTIRCSDGSNHITNCCTDCVTGLTRQDMDDFLIIDANQMLDEAEREHQELSKSFVEMLTSRTALWGDQ